MERYDIAIIGSGPAGLASAINAKTRNKSVIVFGSSDLSKKLTLAPVINNYLGFYGIRGAELQEKFKEHIDNMGIQIENVKVNNIYAMGEYFSIMTSKDTYEASKVILAMGMEHTKPLKGEDKFLGRGVGYCATCDAPLYKGKIVTIVGYNKEAESEANYLAELASKVYYVPRYKDEYQLVSAVEIVKDVPVEIVGDKKVEKLKLKSRELETDGVFVLKDSAPPEQLVPGLYVEDGHIKVNRKMETNIDGCYAAGDCTGKPYQYMKAVGEGQVAALNAVEKLYTKA
ncbi:thioredoxin reductase (NADPH) [Clostridium acetobutylicum]|uniref:Thioredoxin reductase n=2 Tax=Clostridium acetobutylicum (strain ATCC 824 / DSM 792 / JCM 1419 / IAM 19013 / LMG 5710 / NBRC 13948 / NRRL B-527 / VKM B-1787 / 2291 / W) TaxID=272562 RepID=Q97EM8_CLOAB|nr:MULTISPECIES: NAD(P)/FAD-dependent oxidoreductase [Clostridium]AAK81022.1 Thioredoxin reductase [Clostridium acetobutylicum ATCC 824]ADZ22125.1 Thioredoxin reductase [Clostridium acetobutylicum EA 2018]AEI34552.1 thioredoxin reductase [Clostridium acetobutylicum DSM 1731]AWV78567.1 NAD(P)/FAD-dependent oxidoreductase [Clostridium acetobutylicum]MBC2393427.1 NAD(P)/FAD-dependent oxidoreductase [Clostridium acetobutylicum]